LLLAGSAGERDALEDLLPLVVVTNLRVYEFLSDNSSIRHYVDS
jgi:hypothetical protein